MSTQGKRIMVGTHLHDALTEAHAEADQAGKVITFEFNGIEHDARPAESFEETKARAETATGWPILTREESAEQARLSLENTKREQAAAIAVADVPTEQQMREGKVPWLHTPEELAAYTRALTDRPHDYGTCVYAMSMAAVAAFQYVAHKLGVSGFQAGCADMDILRRTRSIEGGFRIVQYDDLLYPQYWDEGRSGIFEAALVENAAHYAEKARALLAKCPAAHPEVLAHWRRLAGKDGAK
jgi:hypothetical protein